MGVSMNNENGLTPSQLAERNATLVTEIEKCRELSGCPAGVDLQGLGEAAGGGECGDEGRPRHLSAVLD